jgi:hypothetical protein
MPVGLRSQSVSGIGESELVSTSRPSKLVFISESPESEKYSAHIEL